MDSTDAASGRRTALEVRGRNFAEKILKGDAKHFGVPGMRWGVRRSREQRAADRARISEDAAKVQEHRGTIKTSGTKALTNKELQEVVTRMNLEQQYGRLSAAQMSKGRKFAVALLGDVAKKQVSQEVHGRVDSKVRSMKDKNQE